MVALIGISAETADVVRYWSTDRDRFDLALVRAALRTGLPTLATANSYHHQCIDRPGEGVRVVATAPDGSGPRRHR